MLLEDSPITAVLPGHYIGERRCGYCHRSCGSSVFGFTSVSLTVDLYQLLMDRGFRRSGTFLYKPDLLNSCCPQYTIRVTASVFRPSKEHRQAINRFNRFILGSQYEEALRRHISSSHSASLVGKHNSEFDLVSAIHRAEYDNLPPALAHIPIAHKFVVRLVPPDCNDEKFSLYRHYQKTCHHEPDSKITKHGFKRFLCGQPFEFERGYDPYDRENVCAGRPLLARKRLGLWHQMYYLDGQLIAMAVLDFLPDTISGVYFMCREEYSNYSLGKLSACREIALSLEEERTHYHMGLYIHSCQKMKYKASFGPSELLDPELYIYFPFDKFAAGFENSEYVSFAPNHRVRDPAKDLRSSIGQYRTIASSCEEDGCEDDNDDGDHLPLIQTVFDADMPGMPSQEQIMSRIDMSKVRLIIQKYIFTGESLSNMHPTVFAKLLEPILQMAAVMGLDLFYEVFLYIQ
ncbi:arginine-tRNA-protein transferase [Lipomyces orientalis]|uniref:Arginine-tRNA-protein transferase n=1 Tax=Lipomyces orientalis TaxID=1233043 RepID=A0ACC3TE81_9ASCO